MGESAAPVQTRGVATHAEAIAVLAKVLALCERSPLHFLYPAHVLFDRIFHSLINGQFRLLEEAGRPSAFVNWAWLSPEVGTRFATGRYHLRREEWRCGPDLWFCEIVAGEGSMGRIIEALDGDPIAPGVRARWLRIGPSGDLHGVGEFRTRRPSAERCWKVASGVDGGLAAAVPGPGQGSHA